MTHHIKQLTVLHESEVKGSIDTARADESRVQLVGVIGSHQHDTSGGINNTVKDIEKACKVKVCLLYTSDAADEEDSVDLGGRRIIKKKKNYNIQNGTSKKTN
eukprot:TRINITY_DN16272_c0_g2_i1.p2 TRINITY_DN16272_c0_g2~~TRINITY_DN16272_c0_g2_i1.p2  ORF type:complete len:103 (+),score=27.81 TRINITY_DN16272_c0_g2_i1:752-1060(+)